MGLKPIKGRKFVDIRLSKKYNINARHVAVPLVGLTFGALFYVYARSSVLAAKENARLHRMADGGQISWRNESQRRHGALDRPEQKVTLKGLVGKFEDDGVSVQQEPKKTAADEALHARKRPKKSDSG